MQIKRLEEISVISSIPPIFAEQLGDVVNPKGFKLVVRKRILFLEAAEIALQERVVVELRVLESQEQRAHEHRLLQCHAYQSGLESLPERLDEPCQRLGLERPLVNESHEIPCRIWRAALVGHR